MARQGRPKNARLRARQLGQTVVSASSRLSRLDNRPDSAGLASVKTTGCVRHASYGDEPKLPLARLSAPSVALFASHAPLHSPPPLRRRPNFNVAQPPPPLRLLSTRNSATNSHFRFIAPLHSPPRPPSRFLLHTRPAALRASPMVGLIHRTSRLPFEKSASKSRLSGQGRI